jgi:sensor histidine kinase YesM
MDFRPASTRGISGYIIIFSFGIALALATASECHSITNISSLLYGVALWVWWACVASALWAISKRVPFLLSFSPATISVQVVIGSVLGVAHLLLLRSLGNDTLHLNPFGMEMLIYGFIFGISSVMQSQVHAQRDAMRALELQRQLSAAHLRALQMQLAPHFLFNTLNAITTLVELGRQQAAAEMLHNLNAMMKSTLASVSPEKVPLSRELEFVGNYLAIEQIRFADRLRVEMNVDPTALGGMVPSFLLQPLVENAIHHGIGRSEGGGVVEASAVRDGEWLHVHVRDTGKGAVAGIQNGHGIGLKNTRERLEHFYQKAYRMTAQPLTTGGFEVAITIPFEAQAL